MVDIRPNAQFALNVIVTARLWLGIMIHNGIGGQPLSPLNPAVGFPTLVYLAVGLEASAPEMAGSEINGVVLFPFLPFYPEQRLRHYMAHVIYDVTQFPLLILMFLSIQKHKEISHD